MEGCQGTSRMQLAIHFPSLRYGPSFQLSCILVTPCRGRGMSPFWLLHERDVAILVCRRFGLSLF